MGWNVTKYTNTTTVSAPSALMYVSLCAGGGGGGGGGGNSNGGGGGGGSGDAASMVPFFAVPGETLTITIGGAGTGGSTGNSGTSGGVTSIASSLQTLLAGASINYGSSTSTTTGGAAGGINSGNSVGTGGPSGGANGVQGTVATLRTAIAIGHIEFFSAAVKVSTGGSGGGYGASGGYGLKVNSLSYPYIAGGVSTAGQPGGGGAGGCNPFGVGGVGGGNGAAGTAGTGYGAGGGGGSGTGSGGNGTAGVLFLCWYSDAWTASDERAALGLTSANLDTQLSILAGYIDTEVAAIKAKTDNLPADTNTLLTSTGIKVASIANGAIAAATFAAGALDAVWSVTSRTLTAISDSAGITTLLSRIGSALTISGGKVTVGTNDDKTGYALDASTEADIASAVMASTVEPGFTLKQSMRLMLAALAGKLSGAATTTVTIRDAADAKNRIVATVDADGNRTAVTHDTSD